METASFIPRETDETKRNEDLFRKRIEKSWNVEMEHLSTAYSLDWAAKREGEIAAFIEMKCRTNAFDKYPTYMIGLKKWNACRMFTSSSHIPVFLAIGFTDGDYFVNVDNVKEFSVKMGGMCPHKRNWTVDREPCVYFSTEYFKKFK